MKISILNFFTNILIVMYFFTFSTNFFTIFLNIHIIFLMISNAKSFFFEKFLRKIRAFVFANSTNCKAVFSFYGITTFKLVTTAAYRSISLGDSLDLCIVIFPSAFFAMFKEKSIHSIRRTLNKIMSLIAFFSSFNWNSLYIFFMGYNVKMFRVYTRSVSAYMIKNKPSRNFALYQSVGYSMGKKSFFIKSKSTIAKTFCSRPLPTIFKIGAILLNWPIFINLAPKSLELFRWNHV